MANAISVFFTLLFGGGAVFPMGEDSKFLLDLRKAGLRFYVSKETIGQVNHTTSTWFTGIDEKYYYGRGAFFQAARPKLKYFWMTYSAIKTHKRNKDMKFFDKLKWMYYGMIGYKKLLSYDDYVHSVDSDKTS